MQRSEDRACSALVGAQQSYIGRALENHFTTSEEPLMSTATITADQPVLACQHFAYTEADRVVDRQRCRAYLRHQTRRLLPTRRSTACQVIFGLASRNWHGRMATVLRVTLEWSPTRP